jgi:hypothetical protein
MLTKLEREVITDSMHKVESIQASLAQIDPARLEDSDDIQDCLKSADKSFREALKERPIVRERRKSDY